MPAKIEYLPNIKASTEATLEDARQAIPNGAPVLIIWEDQAQVCWIRSASDKDMLWMLERVRINSSKD